MAKNTIKIDGEKLRHIIEKELNLSIYQIAIENGYSRNLVNQAIRTGRASPLIQTLMRLYRVKPEEYMLVEDLKPEPKSQVSIDDLVAQDREELKGLIKEALLEVLNSLDWSLDTKDNIVTFYSGKKKEERRNGSRDSK